MIRHLNAWPSYVSYLLVDIIPLFAVLSFFLPSVTFLQAVVRISAFLKSSIALFGMQRDIHQFLWETTKNIIFPFLLFLFFLFSFLFMNSWESFRILGFRSYFIIPTNWKQWKSWEELGTFYKIFVEYYWDQLIGRCKRLIVLFQFIKETITTSISSIIKEIAINIIIKKYIRKILIKYVCDINIGDDHTITLSLSLSLIIMVQIFISFRRHAIF